MGVLSLVILTGAVGVGTPTASWATLQCGDHIGPNASAFLFHDLNCSGSDPALTVEGPATLLMLGHTVDCQDTGAVGIQVIGQAAIVLQGRVTGCHTGVQVGGKGSHLIKEMTAKQNQIGFRIVGGESHGNNLTDNIARNNIGAGFGRQGGATHDNAFTSNKSLGNGFGFNHRGDRNVYKYNLAKGNNGFGFRLTGDANMFMQNEAKENSAGFETSGTASTVIGNTAKKNDLAGIEVGAVNSTILGNTALDNGSNDLIDVNVNCDNNQWVGNRFRTSNESCIH